MAGNDKATQTNSAMSGVLRDVRLAIGDMFGGKLDAKQEVLVGVLFGLLGALARADGVVSTEEAHYTNGLMDELELTSRARKLATEAFVRGCRRIYESLLRLASADAMIRRGERAFLEKVTLGLGYEPAELDARLKRIMH